MLYKSFVIRIICTNHKPSSLTLSNYIHSALMMDETDMFKKVYRKNSKKKMTGNVRKQSFFKNIGSTSLYLISKSLL